MRVCLDNEQGQVSLWTLITAFVAMGMDHCVANMWFLSMGVFLSADYTWGQVFNNNLIPMVGPCGRSPVVGYSIPRQADTYLVFSGVFSICRQLDP